MRSNPAVSLVATASLALGGGGATPAVAAAGAETLGSSILVKVGQAEGLTHLQFDGAQPRSVRRDGDDLLLQFARATPPNLSLLRVEPPRYLKTATARSTPAGIELRLTLWPGVEAKAGRADGVSYVNLSPGAATPMPADQPPERRDDPNPASGVVKAHASLQHATLSLRFDWRALVGAAVFRRGDVIWVVFDARARLDLSEAPEGLPQARRMDMVASPDATVLRILAGPGVQASAVAQGSSWTILLGAGAAAPAPIPLKPDVGGLSAQVAGATGVLWLNDPEVGDRIAVVTARGPAKGLAVARRLVDADILCSAQGLALTPTSSDVTVVADQDVVRISRPSGLQLSLAVASPPPAAAAPETPQPAALPGLINFASWSKTGPAGFMARYDALLQAASDEGEPSEAADAGRVLGRGASTSARLGFARFLVGSELSFEAIGVLDLLAKSTPSVQATAEFRGLRGAARVMAGRYKDAQADFSSPLLSDDPASALWRGYAAAKLGDYGGARQAFAAGRAVLDRMPPTWRERFLLAQAEAGLAASDLPGARAALMEADALKPTGVEADRLQLDLGRLAEASGQPGQAMSLFAAAEASPYGGIAAPALLYEVEAQQTQGKITPVAALSTLESIRFRWRGDATELEAARALGRIYISQGRYREALAALRSASGGPPDQPGAAAVQGDLTSAFRSLFLDGGADGLPPIQALGMFFDFKDLTPVGADGDAMVRKLVRRLVDVDLLDQAAALLKYQADSRLDGVGKAEVDTDVALIQVMNRQPEAALDALNASRTTLLPANLQSRRRVIQARALGALGRYDDALEILADDTSPDAASARAEVVWLKRDWPLAGRAMEVALGDRFKSPIALSEVEQIQLLRAAIAYSLAGDDAGLARLRARYGAQVQATKTPDMLRVALAGGQDTAAMSQASGPDIFAAWVDAMKHRLLTAERAQA